MKVGDRVKADFENFGTVCYIGPMPGSQGDWLGIDWDNEQRGRHNGTYKNRNYFTTKSPTSGSFVRPGKVHCGGSFSEIVHFNYCCVLKQLRDVSQGEDEFFTQDVEPKDLTQLRQMVLHSLPLANCSLEEAEQFRTQLVQVTDIDLSRTLLSDWLTIARIAHALPKLHTLRINDNCIRLPLRQEDSEEFNPITQSPLSREDWNFIHTEMSRVKNLIAVRMSYTWSELLQCLHLFGPQLERLVIAMNNFTSLDGLSEKMFQNLHSLDVAGNAFNSAESSQAVMCVLAQLPNLQNLYLTDCQLHDFTLPENHHCFPQLKTLCLCENKIRYLQTLNELNRLTQLTDLLMLMNPVLEGWAESARGSIIARIGSITTLNRAPITLQERRNAEMEYLRENACEWWMYCNTADHDGYQQFLAAHPRFDTLVTLHGPPDSVEVYKTLSPPLKDGLVQVHVSCSAKDNSTTVDLKIPQKMTVYHLKCIVRRLLKLHSGQAFRLTYSNNTVN